MKPISIEVGKVCDPNCFHACNCRTPTWTAFGLWCTTALHMQPWTKPLVIYACVALSSKIHLCIYAFPIKSFLSCILFIVKEVASRYWIQGLHKITNTTSKESKVLDCTKFLGRGNHECHTYSGSYISKRLKGVKYLNKD